VSASVSAFLAQVRERGAELPPALSGALLLAAVRLSEEKSQALRPGLLMVDDDGELSLVEGEAEDGGYAAPELAKGHAPPRDPRVLVYAAGALGCELCTLHAPDGNRDFAGPLAPVLRKALAPERKKRYRNLGEMAQAIEEIQSRPTHEEERLILAAVAQSSGSPQKLARIELKKASPPAPNVVFAADVLRDSQQVETPKELHPVFAQKWDPLEAPPEVFFEKALPFEQKTPEPGVMELREAEAREAHVAEPVAAPPEPPPPAPLQPQPQETPAPRRVQPPPLPPDSSEFPKLIENERKARQEEMLVLESRMENLARLGSRITALEQEVRSSAPPPRSLAQEVKLLIEERRFAEAELALASASLDDAVLQLRLGQALSGQTDVDGSRSERAEAAFRRAAVLDPAWALPRALLGAHLMKKGKQAQAAVVLRSALEIDPACAEARAALGDSRRGGSLLLAAGAALGMAASAALALALVGRRPEPVGPAAPPAVQVSAVAPSPPPLPERKAEPPPAPAPPAEADDPPPAKAARADKPQPRPRKLAEKQPDKQTAPSGSRAAAQGEAAKGDKALRSFDTRAAQTAFESALKLDPTLPSAHRGMGMVYVLLGKNAEAKVEYQRYLQLEPNAADKDQIERLVSR
jgi:tetratricopeptide (TPR) repeat protein